MREEGCDRIGELSPPGSLRSHWGIITTGKPAIALGYFTPAQAGVFSFAAVMESVPLPQLF